MKKIGIIDEHNFSREKINKLPIRKKVRGLIYKNKSTLICVEEDGYRINMRGKKDKDIIKNLEFYVKIF